MSLDRIILNVLRTDDDPSRVESIKALAQIASVEDQGAVDALKAACNDDDRNIAFLARRALDHLVRKARGVGDDKKSLNLEKFRQYLIDSAEPDVKIRAIGMAVEKNARAVLPVLLERLKVETDVFVVSKLTKATCQLGDASVRDAVAPFLKHEDSRVRANTVEGLAEHREEWAFQLILPTLEDPDNRVRANAIRALKGFKDLDPIDAMRGMVSSLHVGDRASALYVLERMNTPASLEALLPLLNDEDVSLRDRIWQSMTERGYLVTCPLIDRMSSLVGAGGEFLFRIERLLDVLEARTGETYRREITALRETLDSSSPVVPSSPGRTAEFGPESPASDQEDVEAVGPHFEGIETEFDDLHGKDLTDRLEALEKEDLEARIETLGRVAQSRVDRIRLEGKRRLQRAQSERDLTRRRDLGRKQRSRRFASFGLAGLILIVLMALVGPRFLDLFRPRGSDAPAPPASLPDSPQVGVSSGDDEMESDEAESGDNSDDAAATDGAQAANPDPETTGSGDSGAGTMAIPAVTSGPAQGGGVSNPLHNDPGMPDMVAAFPVQVILPLLGSSRFAFSADKNQVLVFQSARNQPWDLDQPEGPAGILTIDLASGASQSLPGSDRPALVDVVGSGSGLAYVVGDQGIGDLWVSQPGLVNPRQLTRGMWVVSFSEALGQNKAVLEVETRLTDGSSSGSDLVLVNLDEVFPIEPRQLLVEIGGQFLTTNGRSRAPFVLPRGTDLVYQNGDDATAELVHTTLNGGARSTVSLPGKLVSIVFEPGSTRFIALVPGGGVGVLDALKGIVTDQGVQLSPAQVGDVSQSLLALTRGGTSWIALLRTGPSLGEPLDFAGDLFRISSDLVLGERLTTGGSSLNPRVSPDGHNLVYIRRVNGEDSLCHISLAVGAVGTSGRGAAPPSDPAPSETASTPAPSTLPGSPDKLPQTLPAPASPQAPAPPPVIDPVPPSVVAPAGELPSGSIRPDSEPLPPQPSVDSTTTLTAVPVVPDVPASLDPPVSVTSPVPLASPAP